MKKVLIATLFACIMLILPLNNVVGVSNVKEDCNCKPVSNHHLIRLDRLSNKLDRLLNRLEVYTGIIPILYKHKPEVTKEFKELSNDITTLRESNNDLKSVFEFEFGYNPIICGALFLAITSLAGIGGTAYLIGELFPFMEPIMYQILLFCAMYGLLLTFLYDVIYECNR